MVIKAIEGYGVRVQNFRSGATTGSRLLPRNHSWVKVHGYPRWFSLKRRGFLRRRISRLSRTYRPPSTCFCIIEISPSKSPIASPQHLSIVVTSRGWGSPIVWFLK